MNKYIVTLEFYAGSKAIKADIMLNADSRKEATESATKGITSQCLVVECKKI